MRHSSLFLREQTMAARRASFSASASKAAMGLPFTAPASRLLPPFLPFSSCTSFLLARTFLFSTGLTSSRLPKPSLLPQGLTVFHDLQKHACTADEGPLIGVRNNIFRSYIQAIAPMWSTTDHTALRVNQKRKSLANGQCKRGTGQNLAKMHRTCQDSGTFQHVCEGGGAP